jgi:hypothetical protein
MFTASAAETLQDEIETFLPAAYLREVLICGYPDKKLLDLLWQKLNIHRNK